MGKEDIMKMKNYKFIIYSILVSLQLFSMPSYKKPIPKNLGIRFKNASSQKVHALFIHTPEFSKVFEAGGWTKKAFESLEKLSLKCIALFPEEKEKKQKDDTEKSQEKKKRTTIPKKEVIEPWLQGSLNSLNVILEMVMQPDVIVDTIKNKDYFKQVFPGLTIDSHRNPTAGQKTSNLRQYTKKGDVTLAIYPDNPEYGLPDFSAPLYIGDFNHGKYNSVIYGPVDGHVTYQHINPKTKKITKSKEKLFVPVEVSDKGNLEIQESGQDAATDLMEKELKKGKIIFE